jgi:TetR/AcrR family transcriptional repressor of mexJK operon
MEAIAREAGVAKQTVYAHFGTKAALFGATMRDRCDWLLEPLPAAMDGGHDPAAALTAIGQRFLDIIMAPEALARLRVVMAERGRFPELAEIFYASGPGRATVGLAEYLGRLHARRVLSVPEPALAASQFFGMVRGDHFLRHLLGLGPEPTPAERERIVRGAVASFLAAHRPCGQ